MQHAGPRAGLTLERPWRHLLILRRPKHSETRRVNDLTFDIRAGGGHELAGVDRITL